MIIYALLKKRSFILDETAVALVRLVHKITYLKLILGYLKDSNAAAHSVDTGVS